MVATESSRPRFAARLLPLVAMGAAGCTFGGLGNYDVETCADPNGTLAPVQQVGMLSGDDLAFSNSAGMSPIAAYPAIGASGACVQAVGGGGYVASAGCALLPGQEAEQPWVVALGGGYGAIAIATAPGAGACPVGALAFQYLDPDVTGSAGSACAGGAALPSLAPVSADGATAIATWYATPYPTRSDPLQSCASAGAATLEIAPITQANTGHPSLGAPVSLSTTGIAIRPAAVQPWPSGGGSGVVVAAPDGDAATVWSLGSNLAVVESATLPALGGARAVTVGVATDGSERIAVAAEIGCAPQTLALLVGSFDGGFPASPAIVAAADGYAAVQATVAWIGEEHEWLVTWISTAGGPHMLARRYTAGGDALGGVIDPSVAATGAVAVGDGTAFAYVPATTSFVRVSLGCDD